MCSSHQPFVLRTKLLPIGMQDTQSIPMSVLILDSISGERIINSSYQNQIWFITMGGKYGFRVHRECRLLLCRPPDNRDTSSVVTKHETEIPQYIANEKMIQCHARCAGYPKLTVHRSGKGEITCRKKARRKHYSTNKVLL